MTLNSVRAGSTGRGRSAVLGVAAFCLIAALFSGPASATPQFRQSLALNSQQSLSAAGVTLFQQGSDGNLVLYDTYGGWNAIWNAGTSGNVGARTRYQTDGNLVVYDASWNWQFQSGTGGNNGSTLVLTDDANLQIFSPNSALLWSSGTSRLPGPTTGGNTIAGAANFDWWLADSAVHTYGDIESDATEQALWEPRFSGVAGEDLYDTTDINMTHLTTTNINTDVVWHVVPSTAMNTPTANAEVLCLTPSGTAGVCNRFVVRINANRTANRASHLNNNTVCHELAHTLGYDDDGIAGGSCITDGYNARLGWWERNQINATY